MDTSEQQLQLQKNVTIVLFVFRQLQVRLVILLLLVSNIPTASLMTELLTILLVF